MRRAHFLSPAILMLCGALSALAQPGGSRFSVRDYQARGDGSSDDQAAIEATIAAARQAGGGVIFFPPGVYLHSGVLNFGSNMMVTGAGAGPTVIQATNPTLSALRFANASNCGVSNLKIAGAPSPRKQNDESAGILLVDSSHCRVNGIAIDGGASAGILIHGSQDVQVAGNDIRNEMADGVHVVAGSNRVLVENNTAFNTGDDSFAAVAYAKDPQTTGVTIRNNTSTNSRARGVTCIGAADCLITGNTISNPHSHGIAVAFETSYNTHHPRHVTVADNTITGVAGSGMNAILIDGAEDVRLQRNHVLASNAVFIHNSAGIALEEMSIEDSRGPAILARDSSDLRLRRNHLMRSGGPGILLERVQGGEVSENHLEDARSGGDAQRGDIDIASSSHLTGSGNTVRHGAASRGPRRGIRVADSDSTDVKTVDN